MQTLTEVQHRLQGLEDIRHLLRSLRAMSAIRWRRARVHLRSARAYAEAVDSQLALVMALGVRERHVARGAAVGLITLTSDRGLCGNFNTGLANEALRQAQEWREAGRQVKVISLGGYGERLYRDSGFEIMHTERFPMAHAQSFVDAREIIGRISEFYTSGAIGELQLMYNQFLSFGSYQTVLMRLLPPDLEQVSAEAAALRRRAAKGAPAALGEAAGDGSPGPAEAPSAVPAGAAGGVPEGLILGTPKAELHEFLLWEHLATQLYLALVESAVSEHGARLQTMDAAISNLDERVAELELVYHAIRQERITQEVLEVQGNLRAGRQGAGRYRGGTRV